MRSPSVVIRSPDKRNLTLSSMELKGLNCFGVPKVFECLLEELRQKLTRLPRVMIFCKNKSDCPKIYTFFKVQMREYFCHPPGSNPDVAHCRLDDMFFKGTGADVKKSIIDNFTKESCLHIAICTDAFGMGVNCRDVELVIHYGVPSDPETYVQQIGRSGREGINSYAVALHSKKLLENCNNHMISYVQNVTCRHNHLFRDFENSTPSINAGCSCCDLCMKKCTCNHCIDKLSQDYSFIPFLFNH